MEAAPVTSCSSAGQESVESLLESNLPPLLCSCTVATGNEFDEQYDLAAAERQALESGSMTPLIKHELKLLIQSRRLSQGKEELRVGFRQPSSCQLTTAELDRRQRRKDQNRKAAKRHRQNKKIKESSLLEEISMLKGKNEGLRDKVTELQQLKGDLLRRLHHHMTLCPSLALSLPSNLLRSATPPPPSPSTTPDTIHPYSDYPPLSGGCPLQASAVDAFTIPCTSEGFGPSLTSPGAVPVHVLPAPVLNVLQQDMVAP